jgi:hypothetical protein
MISLKIFLALKKSKKLKVKRISKEEKEPSLLHIEVHKEEWELYLRRHDNSFSLIIYKALFYYLSPRIN